MVERGTSSRLSMGRADPAPRARLCIGAVSPRQVSGGGDCARGHPELGRLPSTADADARRGQRAWPCPLLDDIPRATAAARDGWIDGRANALLPHLRKLRLAAGGKGPRVF